MITTSIIVGCAISFAGQLPIGYINLLAVNVAQQYKQWQAIYFAIGIALVEMVYLRLIFAGVGGLIQHSQWFFYLQLAMAAVLMIAGIVTFRQRAALVSNHQSRKWNARQGFGLGVLVSALNVMQFPFWLLWSSYVTVNGWIPENAAHYNWFTIGTGLGTVVGMLPYIFWGGRVLDKWMKQKQWMQTLLALCLCIAGITQLYQCIKSLV